MKKWLSHIAGSVLLLAAASCSSSDSANVRDADPGPDGGASSIKNAQAKGTVIDCKSGAPIVGARICIVGRPDDPCTTSRNDGSYILPIPEWTTEIDLAVNISAAGHIGYTALGHESANGAGAWMGWAGVSPCLSDDVSAEAELNAAGFSYRGGYGFVQLYIGTPGISASSSPAGMGPVYLDPSGMPDPTLTGVASNANGGYALIGNLEPGPIEITLSDSSCVPAVFDGEMWADTKPATIAGITVADSITPMVLMCDTR